MPLLRDLAPRLGQYLQWAGITRAELFADDTTRKNLPFQDLRATGITWMAIRGDVGDPSEKPVGEAGFESSEKRMDPLVSRGILNIKGDVSVQMPTCNPAKSGEPDVSRTNGAGAKAGMAEAPGGGGASPRAVMLGHLSADMDAAIAAGDVEAARVAHEAIGRLLGSGGTGAHVVDLAAERERRA